MTDPDELAEWLRARLDEDKRRLSDVESLTTWLAEKLLLAEGVGRTTSIPLSEARERWMPTARRLLDEMEDEPESWYATRARMLADGDAKRLRIEHYLEVRRLADPLVDKHQAYVLAEGVARKSLMFDALLYADRPGYRDEWLP